MSRRRIADRTRSSELAVEDRWDRFVASHPDGDLLQTSAWARVKRPMESEVITAEQDGALVGGARLFFRRIAGRVGFAYCPYGPLVEPGASLDRSALIEELEWTARRGGAPALLIQPPRHDVEMGPVLEARGYAQAKMDVATSASIEADLTDDEDALMARLPRPRRRDVRRAKRDGVEVRQADRSDLGTFIRLHRLSAERNDFVPMTLDYVQRQWDALAPLGHLRVLLAEFQGMAEAAALYTCFGPRWEFKLTGWEASRASSRRSPNDLLKWEAMLAAKADGRLVFDLGGLPRPHAELLLAAGDRMPEELIGTGTETKWAFGTRVVMFPPTFERVLSPIGHVTYKLPARLLNEQGLGSKIVNRLRRT